MNESLSGRNQISTIPMVPRLNESRNLALTVEQSIRLCINDAEKRTLGLPRYVSPLSQPDGRMFVVVHVVYQCV